MLRLTIVRQAGHLVLRRPESNVRQRRRLVLPEDAGPLVITHTAQVYAYPPAVAGPPGTIEL